MSTGGCRIRITSDVDYFGEKVQNKLVYSLGQYFLTTKVFPRISGVYTWGILTSIGRRDYLLHQYDSLLRNRYKEYRQTWVIPTYKTSLTTVAL